MKILTKEIEQRLLRNGRARARFDGEAEPDFLPVVKLFTPDAACTWLLTEIEPDAPDIAFGLCDLGLGCPELGSVSLAELGTLRGRAGLPVERDRHFTGLHPLSVYAAAARIAGCITENETALRAAAEQAGD